MNSVDFNEMYNSSISFDLNYNWIAARVGPSGIQSRSATSTIEIHVTFACCLNDPCDFTNYTDYLNNCIFMDDVDITEESQDVGVTVVDAPTTSGTNNLNFNTPDVQSSVLNDHIQLKKTVRGPAQQYYIPKNKSGHFEGNYQFGRPTKLPVNGDITELKPTDPFYVVGFIYYNINLQDNISYTVTGPDSVSYYFLPESMSAASGSISMKYEDDQMKIGLSSNPGKDNLYEFNHVILTVSHYDRTENLDQSSQ